jgi:hypothetical protein
MYSRSAWRRVRRYAKTAILVAAASLALTAALITPALAADGDNADEGGASLSPAEFTVSSAPLRETPYTIPKNLVLRNYEDEAYLFSVSAEIPPADSVREGYLPIPSTDWVYATPSSSFVVEAHSYAIFQLSLAIPPEEEYTSQKWEVWIAVERIEPESEMISSVLVSRMKIETAGEVSPSGGNDYFWYIGLAIGLALLLLVLILFLLLWRRRRRRHAAA